MLLIIKFSTMYNNYMTCIIINFLDTKSCKNILSYERKSLLRNGNLSYFSNPFTLTFTYPLRSLLLKKGKLLQNEKN